MHDDEWAIGWKNNRLGKLSFYATFEGWGTDSDSVPDCEQVTHFFQLMVLVTKNMTVELEMILKPKCTCKNSWRFLQQCKKTGWPVV